MRLNLGEIALSLGCDPEQVLWRPSDLAVLQPAGSGQTIVPLKKLGQAGSGKRPDQEWGYAPWASILPTGGHFYRREIRKGNLFFCLPGERVVGHAFALDALKAWASAIVTLPAPFEESAAGLAEQGFYLPPGFLVHDVRIALWRVAAAPRASAVS